MKKVLVIVAHPDDEVIWVGGTLIRNRKNWDTTILCMCRKTDKDRYPKFLKVSSMIGAKSFIFDLDDTKLNSISLDEYKKIISEFLNEDYDYVFTHGENGEYGHIRHKEIHKAVKEMLNKKIIKAKRIFFFSYLKKENDFQGYCICNLSANIFIKLNSDELSLKKYLIKNIYGYQKDGFEEKSSGKEESFDEFKK